MNDIILMWNNFNYRYIKKNNNFPAFKRRPTKWRPSRGQRLFNSDNLVSFPLLFSLKIVFVHFGNNFITLIYSYKKNILIPLIDVSRISYAFHVYMLFKKNLLLIYEQNNKLKFHKIWESPFYLTLTLFLWKCFFAFWIRISKCFSSQIIKFLLKFEGHLGETLFLFILWLSF